MWRRAIVSKRSFACREIDQERFFYYHDNLVQVALNRANCIARLSLYLRDARADSSCLLYQSIRCLRNLSFET